MSFLGYRVQMKTAKAFLIDIEKELQENPSTIGRHINHINVHLHNALLACRAANQNAENIRPFSNREFVAPGRKCSISGGFLLQRKHPEGRGVSISCSMFLFSLYYYTLHLIVSTTFVSTNFHKSALKRTFMEIAIPPTTFVPRLIFRESD